MKIKKIKNENELVKEAIRVGVRYLEARGAGKFEATDHADTKVRAIYLLYLASARSRLLYIITLKNTWKTHIIKYEMSFVSF